MSKELIVLDSSSVGLEGRLYRAIRQYNYIHANYQDTWCKLFKSSSFERGMVSAGKVKEVICRLIRKRTPYATSYLIEFLGSSKLLDVSMKRRQKYLLTLEVGQ